MEAKIKTLLGEAVLDDDLDWKSNNPHLERVLNSLKPALGPSGADPNRWLTLARAAVAALGGEVVNWPDIPIEPDKIY